MFSIFNKKNSKDKKQTSPRNQSPLTPEQERDIEAQRFQDMRDAGFIPFDEPVRGERAASSQSMNSSHDEEPAKPKNSKAARNRA